MSQKRKSSDLESEETKRFSFEINKLIKAQNINTFQKSLIISQMFLYKKLYADLRKKIFEIIHEGVVEAYFTHDDRDRKNMNIKHLDELQDLQCDENVALEINKPAEGNDDLSKGEKINERKGEYMFLDSSSKKRITSFRNLLEKYSKEIIDKNIIIANLEKKLALKTIKESKNSSENNFSIKIGMIKQEVDKIIAKNLISSNLRRENIEMRQKIEIQESINLHRISEIKYEKDAVECKNKSLEEKIAFLEEENSKLINEFSNYRKRHRLFVENQTAEYLGIKKTLELEIDNKIKRIESLEFQNVKLSEKIDFLAKKLDKAAKKYEFLSLEIKRLGNIKLKHENITDQNIFDELESLSKAYDRLVEKYKDVINKNGDLELKLDIRREKSLKSPETDKKLNLSNNSAFNKEVLVNLDAINTRALESENIKEELESLKQSFAHQKSIYMATADENDLLKKKIYSIQENNKKLSDLVNNIGKNLAEAKFELRLALDDNTNLSRILDYISQGKSSEILSDIYKYKRLLKCTVCDLRYKDTVINKCMHVFCQECINERIKCRNRKCPNCSETFSSNDVKHIYL